MKELDWLHPAAVQMETENGWEELSFHQGEWTHGDVQLHLNGDGPEVRLSAEKTALKTILIRWKAELLPDTRIFGDAWERAYGDLCWQCIHDGKAIPWYGLLRDPQGLYGIGVATGPDAFDTWYFSDDYILLLMDISAGEQGVLLNGREIVPARIVFRSSGADASPFAFAQAFAKAMCPHPILPDHAVYGGNNWYYTYGAGSRADAIRDSRFIADMAQGISNRPYMVLDDGWQLAGRHTNGAPWVGNRDYGSMADVASEMQAMGVRPGIWFRPMLTGERIPEEWIRWHTANGQVLDPSREDVLEYIAGWTRNLSEAGYELIKHDYSTFDIWGQYGMGVKAYHPSARPEPFGDRSRTLAEIVKRLYKVLSDNAGKAMLMGCNAISHLSAGYWAIQRTGGDTSGLCWERTRRMGINTLAMRMMQHERFYLCDADCCAITPTSNAGETEKWLKLLSLSGTPLFVSVSAELARQGGWENRIAEAFRTAQDTAPAEPLDWLDTDSPKNWRKNGKTFRFDWYEAPMLKYEQGDVWWR